MTAVPRETRASSRGILIMAGALILTVVINAALVWGLSHAMPMPAAEALRAIPIIPLAMEPSVPPSPQPAGVGQRASSRARGSGRASLVMARSPAGLSLPAIAAPDLAGDAPDQATPGAGGTGHGPPSALAAIDALALDAQPDQEPMLVTPLDTAHFYPRGAAAHRLGGETTLILDLGADGSVGSARVIASRPSGIFDQAAIRLARTLHFLPARHHGHAVESPRSELIIRWSPP